MHLSPQDVKELKESLMKIKALGHNIHSIVEERDREIDILDRRLSLLSHPAGKARKDDLGAYIPDNVVDILTKKKEN